MHASSGSLRLWQPALAQARQAAVITRYFTVWFVQSSAAVNVNMQVNEILGKTTPFSSRPGGVYTPSSRPLTDVSRLAWRGGRVGAGDQIPMCAALLPTACA